MAGGTTEYPQRLVIDSIGWEKTPVDPQTGQRIKGWSQGSGYDIEDIIEMAPLACGVILGPVSGGLAAIDFDGPGSVEMFLQTFGRPATDLPQTIGWTSGKDSRCQLSYVIDREWWDSIRGGKSFKNNTGRTVLEFRWSGQQSAIAGVHPETGSYSWIKGCSPAELGKPAIAPEWILYPLLQDEHASSLSTFRG